MNPPAEAWIAAREVAARLRPGVATDALMRELLPWAAGFAIAPVSGFAVGAVALGASGALYAGANVEFGGAPLNASVHAEQAAVANAWMHGEAALDALAVTAAPCGQCRQFLMELTNAERLGILVAGRTPATLATLLPGAFGPGDLGVRARLLEPAERRLAAPIDPSDVLAVAALGAAERSYAPYTSCWAGVALLAGDGSVLTGRYAESAAYNPSLPALQSALSAMALRRLDAAGITAAVMVEAAGPATQRASAEALCSAIGVRLRYISAAPA